MAFLTRISGWIDAGTEWVGRGVGWLTLAMVLIGAYNAIARSIGTKLGMQLGSNAWLEAQWYLFALVFMLGAAATLRHDKHVRVDVFYGRLDNDRGDKHYGVGVLHSLTRDIRYPVRCALNPPPCHC